MARKATIKLRQDTYENFKADASGDGILQGEPVYLTDKKALVIGDGVNGVAGHPTIIPVGNYHNTEVDGWTVTKDNNDIERKFWKDDFSVDSSENYTVANGFAWDTTNRELTYTEGSAYRRTIHKTPVSDSALGAKISFSLKCDTVLGYRGGVVIGYKGTTIYTLNIYTEESRVSMIIRVGTQHLDYVSRLYSLITHDTNYHKYELIINPNGTVEGWFDGVKGNSTGFVLPTGINLTPGFVTGPASGRVICWKDVSYAPSVSYADDFSSDTSERYQPVLGTVAYDDVNKRMNVTTATGANGKASGRLKSYKFCEGSQIYDVLLPTGADGDFICLVTHSANGLMTDGIGVGLQSDGAGNWNLATLSGTTVTEGADSGLDDADVARIEIEKDVTGAYWYYIYDAAGTKPTTATGKLFTTKSEGYTGWYANGNSKTYAIDNISIRAESIVGRTNVEVTEPFWFRDEFGEDSSGRYPHHSIWSISNGTLIRSTGGNYPIWFTNNQISNFDVTFDFKPRLTDGTPPNRKFWFVFGSNRNKVEIYNNGIRYLLRLACGTSSTSCGLDKFDVTSQTGLHTFGSTTDILEGQEGFTSVRILLVNGVLSLYINGVQLGTTYNIGENVVGYIGAYGWGTTDAYEIDNLQISGTRVYQKPIHRGAMLETYHDGTQEVVGTTFIDDFNWDRSEEYTVSGATLDTTNGWYLIDALGEYVRVKDSFSSGYIRFRSSMAVTNPVTASYRELYLREDGDVEGAIRLMMKIDETMVLSLILQRRSSTEYVDVGLYTYGTYTNDTVLDIGVYLDETTCRVDLNRLEVISATVGANNGICKPLLFQEGIGGASAINWKIRGLQIIAASRDASNGIAACIPPIGGGARYGVQEGASIEFTNKALRGDYDFNLCAKTTNPGETPYYEMFFKNTTDDSAIAADSTTLKNVEPLLATYTDFEQALNLKYADRDDTISVQVRRHTSAPDEVNTSAYIDFMAVVPTKEVI